MNRLTSILSILFIVVSLHAQQSPLSENYFIDKYSLAPSYAGNFNSKFLFLGYRTDWTGTDGGPKTFRMSYNDGIMQNAGYGAKFVYDKAGIFNQLYLMGTYSYNLPVYEEHHIMFGLSAGFYHNALNLNDYYNDPGYNLDPSLIRQDVKSKLKLMSDVSVVYTFRGIEAGIMFSDISFGDASYKEVDLKYDPLSNFQVHATYLYSFAEEWELIPLIIVRGGKYIKTQFETAAQVVYLKRFMGSLVFRDPGVFGFGIGANIDKGLKIAYNFNLAANIAMGVFNNHEVTVGFNIFEYISGKDTPMSK